MHSWPTHSAWSEVRTRTFSFFRDMAYESRLAVEVCIMIGIHRFMPVRWLVTGDASFTIIDVVPRM